tara:strand:- start:239 stop:649 length:411 start_codon:yes stop_codon:yes gene_type:complete
MITVSGHGNIVSDPELKSTGSGKAVATLRIAAWNGKDEKLFIDLEAWEDLAENACNSLNKGDRVVFSGTLREDSWQNKDGDKRSKCKISLKEIGPALTWAVASVTKIDERTADSERRGAREEGRRQKAERNVEEPF